MRRCYLGLSAEQREQLVVEAKTWIGTPYRACSNLKGCGTDCGMLIYSVYLACGLVPEIEIPRCYSVQAPLHRDIGEFEGRFYQYFREIPESELLPGDVVMYRLGVGYNHAVIVVDWPNYVLHAWGQHGVSGAHGHNKNAAFRGRQRMYFTLADEYCDVESNALLRHKMFIEGAPENLKDGGS
jgi:hypothetical protein